MEGKIFSFPNPVNEKAARAVAAGVCLMASVVLLTGWYWLVPIMALGFLARVLTGPTLSPLGQLATKVIAPRFGEPVWVAGPPKRFAQSIGLVFTVAATVAAYPFGVWWLVSALMAVLGLFAFLEASVGFCAGCWVFAKLMRLGVIPEGTCEACNNIALRRPTVAAKN